MNGVARKIKNNDNVSETASADSVAYFSQRRPGPEMMLEDILVSNLPELFPYPMDSIWVAGSMQVGAGAPDLTIIHCERDISLLAGRELFNPDMLAYLRVVGRARFDTIVEKLRLKPKVAIKSIEYLLSAQILTQESDVFRLAYEWRNVISEITTIEVKVSNWRQALAQASRNRIFAHKSYVALPHNVARIARNNPILQKIGVGVIEIGTNNVTRIVRRARRQHPRGWRYYYQIAAESACRMENSKYDVYS